MEKTAILFIHGFIGSKRQFYGLRDRLSGCGADMFFQVLPGHEGTLEDFRKTNAEAWQRGVNDRIIELASEYDRLVLVGHSMGGLIAVRAAAAKPEKVVAVVAIGFPLKVRIGREWLKLNLDAAKPEKAGEDPRVTAARSMAGVPIKNVRQYLSTLPQNMAFLKMARLARKELPLLKAPLTVINFERDEIVAKSVPEFVKSRLPDAEIVMLPQSYHFLFQPDEQERMAAIIRSKI